MKTIFISVLLLLGGAAVFVFGNPYYSVFPTNGNQSYQIILAILFLAISMFFKRTKSLSVYWPAAFSLFVASSALFFLSTGVFNIHTNTIQPIKNLALDKFSQFLHVVPVIIVLTLFSKRNLKTIFLKLGKFKQGIIWGMISFMSFVLIALIMGLLSDNAFSSLRTAIPFLLLFIFSNAIMEELWFRGIFLKSYESIVGRNMAIFVTAIVFGTPHIFATYDFPGGGIIFGLVVFVMGLVGAYWMFKSESLIGPVLFHAGYDLLVIVPILETMA